MPESLITLHSKGEYVCSFTHAQWLVLSFLLVAIFLIPIVLVIRDITIDKRQDFDKSWADEFLGTTDAE